MTDLGLLKRNPRTSGSTSRFRSYPIHFPKYHTQKREFVQTSSDVTCSRKWRLGRRSRATSGVPRTEPAGTRHHPLLLRLKTYLRVSRAQMVSLIPSEMSMNVVFFLHLWVFVCITLRGCPLKIIARAVVTWSNSWWRVSLTWLLNLNVAQQQLHVKYRCLNCEYTLSEHVRNTKHIINYVHTSKYQYAVAGKNK